MKKIKILFISILILSVVDIFLLNYALNDTNAAYVEEALITE